MAGETIPQDLAEDNFQQGQLYQSFKALKSPAAASLYGHVMNGAP